jgi:hypothetical protein
LQDALYLGEIRALYYSHPSKYKTLILKKIGC